MSYLFLWTIRATPATRRTASSADQIPLPRALDDLAVLRALSMEDDLALRSGRLHTQRIGYSRKQQEFGVHAGALRTQPLPQCHPRCLTEQSKPSTTDAAALYPPSAPIRRSRRLPLSNFRALHQQPAPSSSAEANRFFETRRRAWSR